MNTKILSQLMMQEPLLLEDRSGAFINMNALESAHNPSLFFGVGLCSSTQPAIAIPFDILSFFFMAEKLRRILNLDTIFILLADTHALSNSFMTREMVTIQTKHMQTTFTAIIRNLHLTHFKILSSSQFHEEATFQKIVFSIPHMENEYVRQEIADMRWFFKCKNVRIKLGWAIDIRETSHGHDERFFDRHIASKTSIPLTFIHMKAGRTFDPKRPKASPYIAVKGESRLMLKDNENVIQKFQQAKETSSMDVINGVRSHAGLIIRLFEELFIRIPLPTLEEKIQFVINLTTKI